MKDKKEVKRMWLIRVRKLFPYYDDNKDSSYCYKISDFPITYEFIPSPSCLTFKIDRGLLYEREDFGRHFVFYTNVDGNQEAYKVIVEQIIYKDDNFKHSYNKIKLETDCDPAKRIVHPDKINFNVDTAWWTQLHNCHICDAGWFIEPITDCKDTINSSVDSSVEWLGKCKTNEFDSYGNIITENKNERKENKMAVKRYVALKFIQKNYSLNEETLSPKTYLYALAPEVQFYKYCIHSFQGCQYYITNTEGYDYRYSKVVILGISNHVSDLIEAFDISTKDLSTSNGISNLKTLKSIQYACSHSKNVNTEKDLWKNYVFGDYELMDDGEIRYKELIPCSGSGIKLKDPSENVDAALWSDNPLTSFYTDTWDKIIERTNEITNSTLHIQDSIDNLSYTLKASEYLKDQPYTISVDPAITNNINKNNIKGENKMNFKNYFKFGPEYTSGIRMSTYGPAFRAPDQSNAYLSYDAANNIWVNVENLVFDASGMFYAMPVALKDLNEGDFILHNGSWVRIDTIIAEDNYVRVENPWTKTANDIIAERSIFGFDFYTKLVSLIDMTGGASADQPFGNPFVLMMLTNDSKGFNGSSFKEMLPLLMLSGANFAGEGFGEFFKNPFALMMMLNND